MPAKRKPGRVARSFLGKLVKKAGRILKKPAKQSATKRAMPARKKKRVVARKK
jgi:hypothetical protein